MLFEVFAAITAFTLHAIASRNFARDAAMQLSLQQAAIGIKSEPHQYQLDPSWNIYAPRQTREFFWEIEEAVGAPDGYRREMLAVNVCLQSALLRICLTFIRDNSPDPSLKSTVSTLVSFCNKTSRTELY